MNQFNKRVRSSTGNIFNKNYQDYESTPSIPDIPIANDLETNDENVALGSTQGVVLKSLIDGLNVETLQNDVNNLKSKIDQDVKTTSIPTFDGLILTSNYINDIDMLELKNTVAQQIDEIDTLTSTVNSHTTSINSLNNTVSTNTSNIGSLTTSINTLSSTVGAHTTSIDTLNSNVATNTTNIGTLTSTVNSHTTSIASIQSTVTSQGTSISNLNDWLDQNVKTTSSPSFTSVTVGSFLSNGAVTVRNGSENVAVLYVANRNNSTANGYSIFGLLNRNNVGFNMFLNNTARYASDTNLGDGYNNEATLRNDIGAMRLQTQSGTNAVGMIISMGGYVGIGKAPDTSPTYILDIAGNCRVSSNFNCGVITSPPNNQLYFLGFGAGATVVTDYFLLSGNGSNLTGYVISPVGQNGTYIKAASASYPNIYHQFWNNGSTPTNCISLTSTGVALDYFKLGTNSPATPTSGSMKMISNVLNYHNGTSWVPVTASPAAPYVPKSYGAQITWYANGSVGVQSKSSALNIVPDYSIPGKNYLNISYPAVQSGYRVYCVTSIEFMSAGTQSNVRFKTSLGGFISLAVTIDGAETNMAAITSGWVQLQLMIQECLA